MVNHISPYICWIIALIILILILGFALWLSGRRRLKEYGIRGRSVYSDLAETKYAEEFKPKKGNVLINRNIGLVGKPDRIQKTSDGLVVWEFKSGKTPSKPYYSHILQLTAYAMLVENEYGTKVHKGYIRYPMRTYEIEITETLRRDVLNTIKRMRDVLKSNSPQRNHNSAARCAKCPYREICEYSLERYNRS